jgi:hypothetical protein
MPLRSSMFAGKSLHVINLIHARNRGPRKTQASRVRKVVWMRYSINTQQQTHSLAIGNVSRRLLVTKKSP